MRLASGAVGNPIRVGSQPQDIALAPDGTAAYVVCRGDGTVVPISLVDRAARRAITIGGDPEHIAITADGQTAYVIGTNWTAGHGTLTQVSLTAGAVLASTRLGVRPIAIVLTESTNR